MIGIQNQLVGAYEGQQVTLECNSEAYPKSINYWTKDNGVIISQGKDKINCATAHLEFRFKWIPEGSVVSYQTSPSKHFESDLIKENVYKVLFNRCDKLA